MVSGMNLLDYRKKYSTKVFFKKRFVRVGRALILGSIACYLLFGLLPGLFYGAQSIADSFGFRRSFMTVVSWNMPSHWRCSARFSFQRLRPLESMKNTLVHCWAGRCSRPAPCCISCSDIIWRIMACRCDGKLRLGQVYSSGLRDWCSFAKRWSRFSSAVPTRWSSWSVKYPASRWVCICSICCLWTLLWAGQSEGLLHWDKLIRSSRPLWSMRLPVSRYTSASGLLQK